MALVSPRPWLDYKGDGPPAKNTLRLWRVQGDRLAKKHGHRGSCNLCKRPLDYWGYVQLRYPGKRSRSKKRRICLNCWTFFDAMLDRLEAEGALDNLPVEELPSAAGIGPTKEPDEIFSIHD